MIGLREEVTTIKFYDKCGKKMLDNYFRGEVGSHKQHFGIIGHVKEKRESLNYSLLHCDPYSLLIWKRGVSWVL